MIAIWALVVAVFFLATVIIAVAWVYYGQSRLDVLSDEEAQDATRPFGQGVMGAPSRPPLNGSVQEDTIT